jgi:hypothetical protein
LAVVTMTHLLAALYARRALPCNAPSLAARARRDILLMMRTTTLAALRPGVAVILVAVMALAALSPVSTQEPAAPFPPRLEQYLATTVNPSTAERRRLAAGSPLTHLLGGDATKEVSVFGAIWIGVPMGRYIDAVKNIETYESGRGFRATRRISSPPRVEDFAELRLPAEDVADLESCREGDCSLKLGTEALALFRKEVDWRAPTAQASADAVMRRILHNYVVGYLEGGHDRLAVYRDRERPTFVAEELRTMINEMPELAPDIPDIRRYLLEYPRTSLPNTTSFIYWQETRFGLKPTIRVSHFVIRERPEDTVVASKMLYATHYFWTALELRLLLPDPARGQGFWLVTVNRSRLDGLSGFTGFFVRRRVRSEVQQATTNLLLSTKRRLESGRIGPLAGNTAGRP